MKHRIACLLCVVLLLGACAASANTSVLRRDDAFSINLDDMTGTETHVMVLTAGNALYLSTFITGGDVHVSIRLDQGDVLYAGDGNLPMGETIPIAESGIYRLAITGASASGSLWIGVMSAAPEVGSPMPYTRTRVQSALGYSLEYDSDYFVMTTSEDGKVDSFYPRTERMADPSTISLTISRAEGSLFALAAELLTEPTMVELTPQVIDWRAARTLRYQDGAQYGSNVQEYTLIETDEDEVLLIMCTYFVGAEGAAEKMQNMIQSIGFTY